MENDSLEAAGNVNEPADPVKPFHPDELNRLIKPSNPLLLYGGLVFFAPLIVMCISQREDSAIWSLLIVAAASLGTGGLLG
jgi:hypothetical protein